MLLTVTLLLILTSTITFYTTRISLVKHQIGLNTQSKVIADNMAAMGQFEMLSQLSTQPQKGNQQQSGIFNGQGQYLAEAQATLSNRFDHKMRIIELASRGESENNLALVNTSQHLISYPIIRTLPDAPLVVNKSLNIENKLILVANPNGAGQGLPMSLWTSSSVDIADINLITCEQFEDAQNLCELSPLSNNQSKAFDIVDSPDKFPEDIYGYLTNLPVKHRKQLLDDAEELISHCESLNSSSSGLIWVQGNCNIGKNQSVGTINSPVILIIEDGDLAFAQNTRIIGLIVMLQPVDSILAANIEAQTNAEIHGALIATESISIKKQPLKIKYDAVVLKNLIRNSNNWRIAHVPNSWRNF